MERATYSVSFYIKRTKKLKDGTSPIFARISIDGQRCDFGLQKSIPENLWDPHKECIAGTSKEVKKQNAYLDFVRMKLLQHKMDLEQQDIKVTPIGLKHAFKGIEENSKTILQVFQEHNDRCKSLIGIDFAPGTYERYATCYLHVERFMNFMYHKKDMKLSELSPKFVKDFEFYLKTERKCAHNSATKYLKNFKKITRLAMTNGWLKEDPFRGIRFHLEKVDMDFLTQQELDQLIQKKMPVGRLELVKDVYVFCCFTGLAFIDVKNLSYSDIQEKNQQLWIHKKRQKTKNWCDVPILPPARHLMEKYKDHPKCQAKNLVFPVLTNQKMNAYLKEIAAICQIDKNLSTHTARHTFATTVTLTNHISIEVVSKMLGHSSINMTKKYARVVDELISEDMQKAYEKYKMLYVA